MKIVVAGGTGYLGSQLVTVLRNEAKVHVLKRGEEGWNGRDDGPWAARLDGADAVVNLAGAPVFLPWTPANREKVLRSRVDSTEALAREMKGRGVKTWLNASAVGYYGDRGEEELTEASAPGTGFLSEVCMAWEEALFSPDLPGTRRVALRTGVVIGPGSGILKPLIPLTRLGLGGRQGSGRQWIPWIHLNDHLRATVHLLSSSLSGPVNLVGPHPARNSEFMDTLRQSVGAPFGLPAPAFGIRLVSKLGGPDPSLALGSTRAQPAMLVQSGFAFDHSDLASAMATSVR